MDKKIIRLMQNDKSSMEICFSLHLSSMKIFDGDRLEAIIELFLIKPPVRRASASAGIQHESISVM
jgi:hypothetical protein